MSETQELILNKLGELCRIYPQQRLGQIIYNYICFGKLYGDNLFFMSDKNMLKTLFFMSDEKMLKILETITKEIEEK